MSEEPLPYPAPSDASCDGQHCVTCSDEAVRVTVLRLLADDMADVETELGTERISVALVPAAVGDTVLVHAGEAIATVEE